MKKKIYTIPQSEVTNLGTLGCWMKELGKASVPSQDFAPKRRTVVF